jgi:hypothetical protein
MSREQLRETLLRKFRRYWRWAVDTDLPGYQEDFEALFARVIVLLDRGVEVDHLVYTLWDFEHGPIGKAIQMDDGCRPGDPDYDSFCTFAVEIMNAWYDSERGNRTPRPADE